MKKTRRNTNIESLKAGEVLEQDLTTNHAQNGHSACVQNDCAFIYESLLFFHGIAYSHKVLKTKNDLKGEQKNHENVNFK